ncbi:armadillo-type protein [Blastocladiella britannica]|nr:armadillo-type protein [Blastocladiella britannica]
MSAATQGIVMALMTMATAMSDPNSAAMFGMLPPHVLMAPPEVTGVVDMSANPLEWPTLPAPKGDGTNGTAVLDAKAAAAEFAAAQAHLASTHEAHEVRRPMDPTTVRELRRKLDFAVTPSDVSAVFILALPRAEDLALDYAGNTVLQKLIERASPAELGMLAQVLTPGLPEVSVHKHGTWVVQKLMDGLFSAVAHTLAGAGSADATGPNNEGGVADPAHLPSSATRELLVALAEYAPALLCDPYGNYVVQNALKLPSATGYVFASVLPHLVSVAQSRFGARALRGCLESQFTTAAQRRRIAVALLDHAEELATHSHGILLLTWVAEHSGFPGCRAALVAAIAPHLAVLATSKVAFPLIFRLASQASEPNARDAIVRHLFLQPPTSSAASGPRSRSSSPAPSSSSATSSVSASNKKARKGGRKASKDRTESTAATNVESPKKPILDQVLADVAVGLPLIHRILGQCILDPALRAECAVQVVRSLSRSAPDLAATAATGAPSSMATTAAAPAGGAHGSGFPPYAMPMMMPPMWPGFHQYYGGGGGGGGAGGQLPPQPYMPFPPMMMYPQPMPHFMPQLGFGGFPPTGSAGGFAAPHMPQQHQQQLVSFEGDGPAVATDDRNGAAEQ